MEFTDREKAIIHEMFFLMNPLTMKVPLDTRVAALKVMLGIRGIRFSEDDLKDMSFGIEAEQNLAVQQGFGFLDKHKDMLRGGL